MFQSNLIVPISDHLKRHAVERPSKWAFRDAARTINYADLERRTANLASQLADLGLAAGESVAIYLPNGVDWVEATLATVRAGGLAVPISIDSTESEVSYRLTDAACRVVITTSAKSAAVDALRAEAPCVRAIILADGDRVASLDALAEKPGSLPARDPSDLDAPAFLVYTSGTTGKPKGVQLSSRGMLWVTASCWAPILGLNADDALLSPLPLFHSYALNMSVISIVATGASIHILEKYSTSDAIRLLESGDFTIFPGVPTMFHYLMEAARERGGVNLHNIRACVTAGAIMAATLNAEFEQLFGVPLLDGYGITETSTMVTMNSAKGGRVLGSCGLPIIGLAVRIVDPTTLKDLDAGQEGELIVRGPNVMLGYLNKPEETAKALRNGWYHTGDLAKADPNGFLTITGRIKELIIRGGQNIAPAEVEEVVLAHESVADCAVVGLPHTGLGEVPGLFVIPRGPTFDEAALMDHCRNQLSSYKVPAVVHVVQEIPRTGSGKIIRFKLRDMVAS
jgi:rifamycin polyketide synthase module 1/2/3